MFLALTFVLYASSLCHSLVLHIFMQRLTQHPISFCCNAINSTRVRRNKSSIYILQPGSYISLFIS